MDTATDIIDEAASPPPALPPAPPHGWSRRRLLGLGALAPAATALAACDAVQDTSDPNRLVIDRATFGPTADVVDRVAGIGAEAWIDEQLDWDGLDITAVEATVAQLPAIAMTPAQLQANYPGNDIGYAGAELQVATAIRQIHSPAQLHERMVEFWSDHFNAPFTNQTMRLLKIVEDREVIRPHALGRFKDLLVADASSPAMLYYLDNAFSYAGNINENYARELLELHTLGVDGGYTETDVVNTARLLTGWTIDRTTGRFLFDGARHDSSANPILDWTRPTSGSDFSHGVDLLHHLASHPSTARFVCTKLARRFVADQPDAGLVDDLAATYLANDTDIRPVLAQLFAHPAFLASRGEKFRRPFEYLVTCARAVRAELTPSVAPAVIGQLGQAAFRLGQAPFLWPAPNGYPDVAQAWLNTGGLLARWNAAGDVAANAYTALQYDRGALRSGLGGSTAAEVVDAFADRVLHAPLTGAGRSIVLQALGWTAGQTRSGPQIAVKQDQLTALLLVTLDTQYT